MLPTPYYKTWLSNTTYRENVYEPSEDSFLLIDAVEKIIPDLMRINPLIGIEIGPGSGIVTAFLTKYFPNIFVIYGIIISKFRGIDINKYACQCSRDICFENSVNTMTDFINGDLFSSLRKCVLSNEQPASNCGYIDFIVFNTPYICTMHEENMNNDRNSIKSSWHGGINGRDVTDCFINQLPYILTYPSGKSLILVSGRNKPDDIISLLKSNGLCGTIFIKRKNPLEQLFVIKISWIQPNLNFD